MTTFTAIKDAEFGYVVCDASIRARSFAMVPVHHHWSFRTERDAKHQAKLLSNIVGTVQTRMIETPERFEEVADTVYGAAW